MHLWYVGYILKLWLKSISTKRNKLVTKGRIMYDSTYIRYLEQSDSWRQKVERQLPGAEGGANVELWFNVYRISVLQNEKSSRDGWWWWCHNIMNAFNANEPYTPKWLRWQILSCQYFTIHQKWSGCVLFQYQVKVKQR